MVYDPVVATDVELLERWRNGDRKAGDELLQRHFESLYRFFRNKAGDHAEDLVQRTLTASLAAPAQFRGDASFRTYLFRIARNELYRHFKRGRREFDPLERSVADLDASMTSKVAARRSHEALLAALRRLPLDLQIVLELHYWEGLSMTELAEVLEIPAGTAKSRIRRARAALREILPQFLEPGADVETSVENLEAWARSLRGAVE